MVEEKLSRGETIVRSQSRRYQILKEIIRRKEVEISDLAVKFELEKTNYTLQSDLQDLTDFIPFLERSRGQIKFQYALDNTYFGNNVRDKDSISAKKAIARMVVGRLLEVGDVTVIGPGSSAYEVAKEMGNEISFVICTNNLALPEVSGVLSITMLGGSFVRDVYSTNGKVTEDAFKVYLAEHSIINKTVIGSSGLAYRSGEKSVKLFVHNECEAGIVKKFIEASNDVIVVTTASKLGKGDSTLVIDLVEYIESNKKIGVEKNVTIVTSDIKASPEEKEMIEKIKADSGNLGINLMVASMKKNRSKGSEN